MAAHPSSVPSPKVQHVARHHGGHHSWCWQILLLAFCILDISISRDHAGRERTVAAMGTLMGHGGNTRPRGHHGRSWRRCWCHLGSAGTCPPAVGQDKPALLGASKLHLGSSLIRRRPTRHHARIHPTALPAGKLVSSTGRRGVPELRAPPELPLRHWKTSRARWQSTGGKLLQKKRG